MPGASGPRRVLVTGSTRGLGHAAAIGFLDQGADVIFHGRDHALLASVLSTLGAAYGRKLEGCAADLADRAAQDRLAAFAGDIDVLVNCAGIYEERKLSDAPDIHWHRMIEINLTAPWRLARALLPGLRSRGGVVINVSSDSALLGYPGSIAYCASKGAIVGLTRALAVELAPDVRALCVCPGPIETDMMRSSLAARADPEAARAEWQSYPLLKRIAAPSEIGEAILFAASARCSYQTGSLIVVDGGASAGRII